MAMERICCSEIIVWESSTANETIIWISSIRSARYIFGIVEIKSMGAIYQQNANIGGSPVNKIIHGTIDCWCHTPFPNGWFIIVIISNIIFYTFRFLMISSNPQAQKATVNRKYYPFLSWCHSAARPQHFHGEAYDPNFSTIVYSRHHVSCTMISVRVLLFHCIPLQWTPMTNGCPSKFASLSLGQVMTSREVTHVTRVTNEPP